MRALQLLDVALHQHGEHLLTSFCHVRYIGANFEQLAYILIVQCPVEGVG